MKAIETTVMLALLLAGCGTASPSGKSGKQLEEDIQTNSGTSTAATYRVITRDQRVIGVMKDQDPVQLQHGDFWAPGEYEQQLERRQETK